MHTIKGWQWVLAGVLLFLAVILGAISGWHKAYGCGNQYEPLWQSCGLPAPGTYYDDGRGGLVNENGVHMAPEWANG